MNVNAAFQQEILPPEKKKRPSLRDRWDATPRSFAVGSTLGLGGYILVMALTIGTRPEHFLGCGLLFWAFHWNQTTRRFALGMVPILAAGFVYDLTHLTTHYVQNLQIHLHEPYDFDKHWFGIHTAQGVLTPNEFFAIHHWPFVDFITGTAYIVFMYWAIGFAAFLSFTGTTPERWALAKAFGWVFFIVNVVGYATYYIYPAAPPWYISAHGFTPDFTVTASPAACVRWDEFTGINYFKGFYGRSADIFGAIPSLHVALPLMVFLYSLPLKKTAWTITAFLFYALVCFSAIYLQHHYILDVAIGSTYALIGYAGQQLLSAGSRNLGSARPAEPSPTG